MEIEEFVALRGRSLVQTAFLLTGDLGEAEDLVQTALTRCLGRWERIEHPYTYVKRAVVTSYLDGRRRTDRDALHRATELVEQDHPVSVPTDSVETADALWRALDDLSPRERAVVVLRFYEDLDDAEIARELGVRSSTVRATVSRALSRLRRLHDHDLRESHEHRHR